MKMIFEPGKPKDLWEWIGPQHLGIFLFYIITRVPSPWWTSLHRYHKLQVFWAIPKHKSPTQIHKKYTKDNPSYIRRPSSRVRVSHTHYYICSPDSQSRRGCCSLVNINLSHLSPTNHKTLPYTTSPPHFTSRSIDPASAHHHKSKLYWPTSRLSYVNPRVEWVS